MCVCVCVGWVWVWVGRNYCIIITCTMGTGIKVVNQHLPLSHLSVIISTTVQLQISAQIRDGEKRKETRLGGRERSTILHMYINEAWSATSHHKVASLSGTLGEGT